MKVLLMLVAVLAAVGVADAHTAGNVVGGSRAGSGSGAISGYAVSGISYELTGESVSAVSFSLEPRGADTVRVRLSPTGAWHACLLSESGAVCAVADVDVAELSRLDVVAAG